MYSPSQNLPEHSRIWIYQCNRELSPEEVKSVSGETRQFLESWTAHDQSLQAGFEIRYNRFLILMIDEKIAGASGCSIDKSLHFIQSLEKKYSFSLLDRMKFALLVDSRVEVVSANELSDLFAKGIVTEESIVFNNLVQTKKELASGWQVPLKDSWHRTLAGV